MSEELLQVIRGERRWHVEHGDSHAVLRTLRPWSIDAVVCDPPYGIGFMGRQFDQSSPAFDPRFWKLVLRVVKPGGHLIAFGGCRTWHRIACAIEDAGWELRDSLGWLQGCLSEDTEILVDGRWEPYHSATEGRRALCYDAERDEFTWQPIRALYVYPYRETAYRITSGSTDQIVSRNHRVVLDRGRGWEFVVAEEAARQPTVRVPVLEDVRGLLATLPDARSVSGGAEQDVFDGVCGASDFDCCDWSPVAFQSEGRSPMRDVWCAGDSTAGSCGTSEAALLLAQVQRRSARRGVREACVQGACGVDRGEPSVLPREDDGRAQPRLEGWRHGDADSWQLRRSSLREMPTDFSLDGSQGWVRDGAPAVRRASVGPLSPALGGGASREPRPDGQSDREPSAVRKQPRSQAVRASRFTRADLVRMEPVQLDGIVWCVNVPTGAFVARRNGKVFITGNSGFPKSQDVSKAFDKRAGEKREVVGTYTHPGTGRELHFPNNPKSVVGPTGHSDRAASLARTAPVTDEAAEWEGFGSALKPAWEPIVLARAPLAGTIAENIEEHGTGGLNIDGCRVGTTGGTAGRGYPKTGMLGIGGKATIEPINAGRWPSNVLLSRAYGDLGAASRFFPTFAPDCDAPFLYMPKASRREREQGLDGFPTPSGPGSAESAFSQVCAKCNRQRVNVSGACECAEPEWIRVAQRLRSNVHTTVKPIALMRWLVRLVTPPDGVILDPFTGSGSTGCASLLEGFRFVGTELYDTDEEPYVRIARARIAHWEKQADVQPKKPKSKRARKVAAK